MTDYLDLLLDARQEEDEDEPFVWKRRGRGYRGSGSEDGPEQRSGREKAGVEWAGRQDREPDLWTQDVSAKTRAAEPQTRLAALERAVARSRARQTAQGWNRERVQTVQGTDGHDMRRLAVEPGAQRRLAGWLDAAFERDARRYDGPLGLF